MSRYKVDGRLEMSNNAAERAMSPVTLGRPNQTFLGSDTGGERVTFFFTIIHSCKLNKSSLEANPTHIIKRIADRPAKDIDQLLRWN